MGTSFRSFVSWGRRQTQPLKILDQLFPAGCEEWTEWEPHPNSRPVSAPSFPVPIRPYSPVGESLFAWAIEQQSVAIFLTVLAWANYGSKPLPFSICTVRPDGHCELLVETGFSAWGAFRQHLVTLPSDIAAIGFAFWDEFLSQPSADDLLVTDRRPEESEEHQGTLAERSVRRWRCAFEESGINPLPKSYGLREEQFLLDVEEIEQRSQSDEEGQSQAIEIVSAFERDSAWILHAEKTGRAAWLRAFLECGIVPKPDAFKRRHAKLLQEVCVLQNKKLQQEKKLQQDAKAAMHRSRLEDEYHKQVRTLEQEFENDASQILQNLLNYRFWQPSYDELLQLSAQLLIERETSRGGEPAFRYEMPRRGRGRPHDPEGMWYRRRHVKVAIQDIAREKGISTDEVTHRDAAERAASSMGRAKVGGNVSADTIATSWKNMKLDEPEPVASLPGFMTGYRRVRDHIELVTSAFKTLGLPRTDEVDS